MWDEGDVPEYSSREKISESEAVESRGWSSYEFTGQEYQALPALALQLSNSLQHLQTLLFSSVHCHLDQASYLERTKASLLVFTSTSLLIRERHSTKQSVPLGRNSKDNRDCKEVPETGLGNKKK